MEKIGKDDVIMEQSIEFLKCYRKEYDSFEEEMKERELRGISIGEARGEKRGIKLGEQRGISLGEKRGIKLGKKDGIKENQLQTAKKMLDLKMDIPTIMKITGLSKKKILQLKDSQKN